MDQGSLQLCRHLSQVTYSGAAHLKSHCSLSTPHVFVLFRAYFSAGIPQCWGWMVLSSWSWLRVLCLALEWQVLPRWVETVQVCERGFWQRGGRRQRMKAHLLHTSYSAAAQRALIIPLPCKNFFHPESLA